MSLPSNRSPGSGERPLLSVVVPVYRSERIVSRLCEAVRAALSPLHYELILVNDCSPDRSWQSIEQEARTDHRVKGVNLRRNVGQDRAIMAGLAHATGDFTVVMDDDLQHDPHDIPRLYSEIQKGFDVCYARFHIKRQTPIKNLGSWAAGKVGEAVLDKPPHIYMSPFKVMRREIVDAIVRYRGPFPYVDGLLFQITSSIGQITVEHHDRAEGRSTHTFWKQLQVFLNLSTNFSVLPLRLMTAAGVTCSASAFVLGLYFLAERLLEGIEVYGWTALMLVNLFFGGTVLISLGLVGEYLGRVLMNVNQVPQFVVRGTVNLEAPTGVSAAERGGHG
ncbi:MAG: glycosyltransferase family 2 protein [Acidobacteria bacterium]|nr:glycosyltransferase family 2 protein [Acidobacteriota bacterium]